jgi:hypothetical protein
MFGFEAEAISERVAIFGGTGGAAVDNVARRKSWTQGQFEKAPLS